MEKMIRVYTDGASRGNPGPGAIAYIITDARGSILRQNAKFIGECTNNIAEYSALILALDEAAKIIGEGGDAEVACYSDSQLMISQLNGDYKVKKGHLKELFDEVKMLERRFKKVSYKNVPRNNPMIAKADKMVNGVLNSMNF